MMPDATPHMLSGGRKQRVELGAPRWPGGPRIMLMDPSGFPGLDNRLADGIKKKTRDETLQVPKEEGTAVVLVTHGARGRAMRMADQIAVIRNGRVVRKRALHTSTSPGPQGRRGVLHI